MTATRWTAVAALIDPVRRSLYDHVRRQGHPVTREEAAAAVAISRTLTAFHLDKLVDAGLLRARYEAPADQPRGRGRTPKVYEATEAGLTLSVPPRQYELVGEILAGAIATQPTDAASAASRLAAETGQRFGSACQARTDPDAGADAELAAAYAALVDLGFEPATEGGTEVSLRNCPFHALAARHPDLICGLNREFVTGLLAGLGATALRARLRPCPGACCVRLSAAS